MNHRPDEPRELPDELVAEMRKLGEVRAPHELWERVTLARLGETPAPGALWERVAPEVADVAAQRTGGRVLSFPLRRVAGLTAAAAAALFLGIAMFTGPAGTAPGEPVLAQAMAPEDKQALRRRFVVLEVDPGDLSSAARSLAGTLGAFPMEDEG